MATEPRQPMFKTLADLKLAQRLDDTITGTVVERVLGVAIDDARNEFYMKLGLAKSVELTGLSEPPDPPTSEDHHKWLLARATEHRLVRRTLLSWLTKMVKDGGNANILEEWNEVGAFRDMSPREVEAEITRLNDEIAQAFEILAGTAQAGQVTGVKAMAIGSTLKDKYRVVGFSIHAGYLFCFSLDSSNESTTEGS